VSAAEWFHKSEAWGAYLREHGYMGAAAPSAPPPKEPRPTAPAASLTASVLEASGFLPDDINSILFDKNARLMDETLAMAARKGGTALVRYTRSHLKTFGKTGNLDELSGFLSRPRKTSSARNFRRPRDTLTSGLLSRKIQGAEKNAAGKIQ